MSNKIFNRRLKVKLYSSIIENNSRSVVELDGNEVYIQVTSEKFLSYMKDETLVKIYNLDERTYQTLITKKYDTIKVFAGYEGREFLVATNTILYISKDKSDLNTPITQIVCSSRLRKDAPKASTFKVGTSIWSALNLLCKRINLKAYVDPKLKDRVLQEQLVVYRENDAISQILRNYDDISISNESNGLNYDVKFELIYNSKKRVIHINPLAGSLIRDWVQVTSQGEVEFNSLLVYNYCIGDAIHVDSLLLNQHADSFDAYLNLQKILNYWKNIAENQGSLDDQRQNLYIITNLNYNLDIRGNFEVTILAKPGNNFKRSIRRFI